jgi:hypothetical protein
MVELRPAVCAKRYLKGVFHVSTTAFIVTYLLGMFVFDLLAVLPADQFDVAQNLRIGSNMFPAHQLRALAFSRLTRLLRSQTAE